MKSAKEMFEELGYKQEECTANSIEYYLFDLDKSIDIHINFDYATKTFSKDDGRTFYIEITTEEFKAIQQQLYELGWLEQEQKEDAED